MLELETGLALSMDGSYPSARIFCSTAFKGTPTASILAKRWRSGLTASWWTGGAVSSSARVVGCWPELAAAGSNVGIGGKGADPSTNGVDAEGADKVGGKDSTDGIEAN